MGGPGSGRRKADPVARAVAQVSAGPQTTQQAVQPSGILTTAQINQSEAVSLVSNRITNAFNTAFKCFGNNPTWDNNEELQIMRNTSYSMYSDVMDRMVSFSGGSVPNTSVGINPRFAKRYPVSDMNVPHNPMAVIQLSLRYAMENPFCAKALRVKADFTCKDFKHKTHNSSAKKFYDEYARKLQLRTALHKIVWNLYATGLCPVYWGGEGINGPTGPITYMQVLNPASVHMEEVLGRMKMWIKMTPAMVQAVQDPEGKNNPRNSDQYASMPAYWIDQIKAAIARGDGQGLIALQEGSYTVIDYRYTPYNRSENTLDGVPLQGAFDALQRYRLLAAGDFAVAWNVKNMLTLISEGDPKDDPKDYKPADNVRLSKLYQQFSHPDQALTIFCDPTTNVRYIVPPLEVFDPIKYKQVEKEIKEVLNLPSFMWANEGNGTYGAAQAEVQLLRQEIQSVRMLLEDQFFYPLYKRLRDGASRPKFAEDAIPMPTFDQNSLRDDALWLSANQENYARGTLSMETLCEIFGWDFAYEIKQKEIEHTKYGNTATGKPGEPMNNSVARPLFEPSQGNLNPSRDKGGNEGKPGGEHEPVHRAPRKSGE